MKTYKVTFEITSETHPRKWDWDNFLNCSEDENYEVLSIEEKGERMSEPTKEYLFAKAALCSDLARQQLEKQEIAQALRNMERANRAMARIFNLDEEESK